MSLIYYLISTLGKNIFLHDLRIILKCYSYHKNTKITSLCSVGYYHNLKMLFNFCVHKKLRLHSFVTVGTIKSINALHLLLLSVPTPHPLLPAKPFRSQGISGYATDRARC